MSPLLSLLFSQIAVSGGGIIRLIVIAIVVIAVIAIFWVFVRASGVAIPPWLVQIFWIVLAAVVAILAIYAVVSLL